MTPTVDKLGAGAIVGFARALTGVRALWAGGPPTAGPRVYYANHASHGDFALVWACLPADLRERTRPVAGADYWERGALRRHVATRVLNAVLIDREAATRTADPIDTMTLALANGDSLIVFPEGTRNTTDAPLLPFKSGLYHLAQRTIELEVIPALRHSGVGLFPLWTDRRRGNEKQHDLFGLLVLAATGCQSDDLPPQPG